MALTKENYYSLEMANKYMGSTQFKGFLECPAKQMAILDGKWSTKESPDMLIGKTVHAWNEGILDQFVEENREKLTTSRGAFNAQYHAAINCIDALKKQDLCLFVLEGEKEVMFEAELFGAKWKILIDSYSEDYQRITDLKCLRSLDFLWNDKPSVKIFTEQKKVSPFEYYGYFIQISLYCEIHRLATGRSIDDYFLPYFCVVTKEIPCDVDVIAFDMCNKPISEIIKAYLHRIERHMPYVLAIKNKEIPATRCEMCDFCRGTKILKAPSTFEKYAV